MRLRFSWGVRSGVVAACATLCWSLVSAEQSASPLAQRAEVVHYEAPGGETFFALKLQPEKLFAAATAHDHVIIVDTSASQAGAHRRQSLAVLDGLLAALPETDRVRLYAVDVTVSQFQSGFAAPRAEEVRTAVAQLKKRVPLGSSQLLPALQTALQAFDGSRSRSVIYIGDGMSAGQLLNSAEMQQVVSEFRRRQIPVHSYGLGPRVDLQVLGILAQHTGGRVFLDSTINDAQQSARQTGVKLAQAAGAPVFYPETISCQPAVEQLLPGTVPPLRADRETILLGRGPVAPRTTVQIAGAGATLTFTAQRQPEQAGNTFLSALWNMAEKDHGLTVAVAGNELFNTARAEFESQVALLVAQGRDAVAQKNPRHAEQIAWTIRQADPHNASARMILNAAQQVRKGGRVEVALAQGDDTKKPDAVPAKPRLDDTPDTSAPRKGTARGEDDQTKKLLDEADATYKADLEESRLKAVVRAQQLVMDVNRTIEAALRVMNESPDAATTELERVLSSVKSAADIDANIRESLRTRVMSAINQVKNRKEVIEKAKVQQAERLSAQQARRQMMDRLLERENKMTQLIDNVRALIFEGFLGNENAFEEAEAVARAAWELDPYNGATVAAIFNAEAAGQLDKAMRLRSLRADKFLAVLYQVELSHVPFPDEPPILWPAPEVWKALTERRKKWASVDLMKYRPTEEKIRKALESPSSVMFVETPLKDALLFLKEQHGINIWTDDAALTEDGIAMDQPVTLNLSDIQLRSVLKLMLEPKMSYIIEDEVLKITTTTKANEKFVTRVYAVGDLVIPIQSGMAGGLGMGMGGVGGIGMGGQGMMGGQFGGGMGGMGGGMGMFNVADEPAREIPVFDNNTVRQQKKKL